MECMVQVSLEESDVVAEIIDVNGAEGWTGLVVTDVKMFLLTI